MKQFRKVIFWCHLIAGVTAGIVILIMSVTGVLLTYERQVEGWRSITLQLPAKPDAPVTFAIDRGNGGQPQLRSQLTINRATGEVVRWEPASNNTAGRRFRSWLRFAHTGEVYGLLGQTVAGLVSLGGAFLVYTGLSLAWRRFYSWRGRRSRAQQVPDGVKADA